MSLRSRSVAKQTLILVGLIACACRPSTAPSTTTSAPTGLLVLRADNLVRAKAGVRANDERFRDAYDDLLRDANVALTAGPFSVMQKKRMPPSGDKHDYMSLAPYWWPDSTKPGGVPFIRRDGDVNP